MANKYDNSDTLHAVIDLAFSYQMNSAAFTEGLMAASCGMDITDHSYEEDEDLGYSSAIQHWFAGYLTLKPTAAFDLGVVAGEAKVATGEYIASPFYEDMGIGAQAWMDGFDQATSD